MRSLLCLLTLLMALGCSPSPGSGSGSGGRQATPQPTASPEFVFTLAEGAPGAGGPGALPVEARPLTEAETAPLLARLPAPKKIPGLKQDFALREGSLPPPRTGVTEKQPFPPPMPASRPPEVDSGPLEVLRRAPEGEVEQVPQLSVTFSQPMVAVTSHEETLARGVPVRLAPEPEGQWRWVGTRTVLFEPRGAVSPGHRLARFPMATEYTVEVPAGTASASGAKLAQAERWTFRTPPPLVESSAPVDGPHPLAPLFAVRFNQDVVPSQVLPTIKVDHDVRVRLATSEEASDVPAEEAARWVFFKATAPLRPATKYTVTIGPGTPSAEGPLKTTEAQEYTFQTYEKLRVEETRCGWNGDCPPLQPFSIRFNNPIDEEKLDPARVKVEPELPGLRVEAQQDVLWVRGQTKGRTRYTVTLPAELADTFGQTLGAPEKLTFDVGSATPSLISLGGQLVTLQSGAYPVFCLNHDQLKVRVHAVAPEDWGAYLKALEAMRYDRPFAPPGRSVVDRTQTTGARPDELTEVSIDLEPALREGKGHAVVVVEPARQTEEGYADRIVAWVQVTDLGLDAATDSDAMQVYVSRLADGRPIAGAEVQLGTTRVESGQDGMARLTLTNPGASVLVARHGHDSTILPGSVYAWDQHGWARVEQGDRASWFVFDDRQMYRPGEEARLKGWIRRWQPGPRGDIAALGEAGQVSYTLHDSMGNEIAEGQAPLSPLGGFDLTLKLPRTMNLGSAYVELSGPLGSTSHGFQVQEFRRPEFEVSASSEPESCLVGERALAVVRASYYAGGGLPNAPTTWEVSASPGSFQPPGRDDYSFGRWTPWWDFDDFYGGLPEDHQEPKSYQARTDSSGAHRLEMRFASVAPPRPMVVRAEASVEDVNRQAWSASTSVLVHPSEAYVGLKTPSTFVERGQPIELEALVCDREGKALAGAPIEVRAARVESEYRKGRYQTVELDVQTLTGISTGDRPSRFTLKTPAGGSYQIVVRTHDQQKRPNESTLTVWVPGGKQPPDRSVTQERVELIPDKKEHRPGETARLLVQAPFYPCEGILTLRRSGLVETRRFRMEGPSTVLEVPIASAHIPNLYAQVDLDGQKDRRPAYATGQLNLPVPPFERTLQVEVKPAAASLDPGADTSLAVRVTDAAGQPVPDSEVAVVMVDEAVLALTGYKIPDPVQVFYANREPGVRDAHSRQYLLVVDLDQMAQASEETKMRGGQGLIEADRAPMEEMAPTATAAAPVARTKSANGVGSSQPPVKMRTNFDALALFAPHVRTDRKGGALVKVKLPDNLTRYRVVAVAVAGANQFGRGEASVTARLPLMVRPSPPRFLNFGDRCELPIVVQNRTDRAVEVQVVMRAQNATLAEGSGRAFRVAANDRAEVRFPVSTDSAGRAAFQVGAFSGDLADASEFELPVWTPATTEAFATYGTLDRGAVAQPVKAPDNVWKQFGGLEITTTSTAVAELTDAVIYLAHYPFECSEQISSRVLGVVALQDVLAAFKTAELPDPKALKERLKLDLDRLRTTQRPDGGFGFWTPNEEDYPYLGVHVGHTLVRAKLKGYPVPEDMLSSSQSYLREVESHIPGWYSPDCRRSIIAYALWARYLNADRDVGRAKRLISEAGGADKLPLEALGWILPLLSREPEAAAIRRHLRARVVETAEAANFTQGYGETGRHLLLASDRRVDAVVLEGLILDSPQSDLIPKLVRGLLSHRRAGRWLSTQENVFALLALDRYFDTYEKVAPDFVARVWLGSQYAGEQAFRGRSADRKLLEVPMARLRGTEDLVLAKTGPGRLYYRIGMRYAPADLKQDPVDQGFTVERAYEAVDDPQDVSRGADGVWTMKAGSRVRVRLTMAAPNRRYHVALVEPLPAGLEPMNPALAVTGRVPLDPRAQEEASSRYWFWMMPWYEHQNLRDERVEAFTSLLWEGVYTYTYVARATTPGTFVVPPTKAEEMYNPETFGRSASDRVVVR